MFRNYTDDITYWGAPVPNGQGGESFAAPVTLKGRWVEKNEEVTTSKGEQLTSKSVAFLKQDVEVGGYLYYGTSTVANPRNQINAQEIRVFIRVPSIRHNWTERRAICV